MIEKILERLEEEALQAEKDMGLSDTFAEAERSGGRWAAYEKVYKIVQEVAKEYGNGWIPVTERVPEELAKDCLVTLENGAVFQAQYVKYNKQFRIVVPYHGVIPFHENNPVIAWMELPAPYQKGEPHEHK